MLKETFAKAKLPAEIEVPGAAHGWCRIRGLQRATGREGLEPFDGAMRKSSGLNTRIHDDAVRVTEGSWHRALVCLRERGTLPVFPDILGLV